MSKHHHHGSAHAPHDPSHDGHDHADPHPPHAPPHEQREGPEHPHAHDHGHGEGHDHDHDHAHGHRHAAALTPRDELPRGAGIGKILFLDAPSGLAGDMIIAALVDLGVPGRVVAEAAASLPIDGFHLHFGTAVRSGIVATTFDVHVDAEQPERTYATVRSLLAEARLSSAVRGRALATFEKLAKAEAKVHRAPIDAVHFHEVGAVDALVDVVGSAAALEYLGVDAVVVSPLPMGRGFVRARHGVLPLPAPAVVECLAGFATYDGEADFEFVTPTGAAIVAAHARESMRWPSFAPLRVGWGAGTHAVVPGVSGMGRPNVLRAVLGERPLRLRDESDASNASHVVLEANLDDATGELVGMAIDTLLGAGALDAWATPLTMKKGRPAFAVSAITRLADADAMAHLLLRETTSLGVRRYPVSRVERPRRTAQVATPYGFLPVKIAEGPFGPPQMKPEFDPCAAAARLHGVPVREVLRAVMVAAAPLLSVAPAPGAMEPPAGAG